MSIESLKASLSDRYTIERELGAGGMATVYLAHDIKHDRKVAIKVLKPELAAVLGAERFVQEIKTTAALSHPHILPLFDSGSADGQLFYVMPYIQGETIREKLNREHQFSIDDAVGITTDVASALDYAHRHGVIHRDIKPENILLHDGRPMVMDFGIALAVSAAAGGRMTETGLSLGTPHYMSPEQATADKEITGRSDIYSLGSVCYEMLTGEPPHMGTSAQQIIMKIVTEDAAPVTKLRKSVPPNVAAAVNKSLEKLPADRFATAKEFAEALGNVAFATAMPSSVSVGGASRWKWALAGGLVAAVVIVAGARLGWLRFLMGHGDDSRGFDGITFTQRTFKTEPVFNARFASDGQTIVFSAAPTGNTPRLFIIRPDYPNPQILGDSAMQLLSISSRDQMAVLVGARFVFHRVFTGTLASMPVSGGAPREILAGVRDADWSPHDSGLAVIRRVGGEDRLEYPIGKVLYQTTGYLSDLRFSPKGDRIAFFVHPLWADDAGGLVVVDLAGGHRILTEGYGGLEGVVWSPDGERVLFDGQRNGGFYQTYSVTLKGQVHLALPNAGSVTLQDVSQSGSWLLTRDDAVSRLIVKAPGARQERDVSWLDLSTVPSISGDGLLMAFDDGGLDAGPYSETMIRKTDGSPAVRLGEGLPWSLSPDKQWVLSVIESAPARLMFYPTGAGQARQLDDGEFASYSDAQFFPGGKQLLVCGTEPEHASRCYVRPVDGGTPRPLTPDGTTQGWISPDGRNVLSQAGDSSYSMYPVDGTAPRPVPSLTPDDAVQRWSPDGRALWVVSGRNAIPVHVDRLDLSTGRRTPLVTFGTETSSGLLDIHFMSLADDPNVYAYEAPEYVSRVFEVTGLR